MEYINTIPEIQVGKILVLERDIPRVHSVPVALVPNPAKGGHVSPQFIYVFDDDFTTVPYMQNGTVPPEKINMHFDSTINRMHTAAFVFATEVGHNDVFTYKDVSNPTSRALLPCDFHAVDEVGATPSSPGLATAGTQRIPATTTAPFQPRIAEVTFHPPSNADCADDVTSISQCRRAVPLTYPTSSAASLPITTFADDEADATSSSPGYPGANSAGMQNIPLPSSASTGHVTASTLSRSAPTSRCKGDPTTAQPHLADAASDLSSDRDHDYTSMSPCHRHVTATKQAGHILASPANSCASPAQYAAASISMQASRCEGASNFLMPPPVKLESGLSDLMSDGAPPSDPDSPIYVRHVL